MTESATSMIGIFGAGRNGSTLIARLLDGSPDVWLHPIDVVFLPTWDDLVAHGRIRGESARTATTRRLRNLEKPLEWRAAARAYSPDFDAVEDLYVSKLVEPLELRRDELAALDRDGVTTARVFFPAFLAVARRVTARDPDAGTRLLSFKTSETAYVDDYVKLWPEMRCLHIVRNPISNYRSAKRTWMERKQTPFWTRGEDLLQVFLEARWLPHARAILRYRASDPGRHVLVRYEDLIARPEPEVLRVCAELGIQPPPDPTLQTVLGGERMRELPRNVSQPGVQTPERVVSDLATRYGYEDVVTAREADLIARATGDLARALGYDDTPVASGRLSLWFRWLPVDASERRNATSRRRLALELVKRRLYVTRALLSS